MTEAWNGRPPAPLDGVGGWFLFTRHQEDYKEYTSLFWMPGVYDDGKGGLWSCDDVAETFVYECPLFTPDQIGAQIAEAVKAEREALERRIMRAADAVMNISTDAMHGDNLAITLCSLFERDDEDGDDEGENGWSEAVITAYEDVRQEIKRLFDEAICARGETQ